MDPALPPSTSAPLIKDFFYRPNTADANENLHA
jgi:hypothetical protein